MGCGSSKKDDIHEQALQQMKTKITEMEKKQIELSQKMSDNSQATAIINSQMNFLQQNLQNLVVRMDNIKIENHKDMPKSIATPATEIEQIRQEMSMMANSIKHSLTQINTKNIQKKSNDSGENIHATIPV